MMRVRGIAFGMPVLLCLVVGLPAAAGQDLTREAAKPRTEAVATAAGATGAETEGEPVHIFLSEPRPFGYVIGDIVERRITMVVAGPARLQTDSIPKVGRSGAWLELRKAQLDSREEGQSTRYQLTLTYQLMNVAPEVQTIDLPPLHLSFDAGFAGAQPFNREIANWPITVAPLTPEFVLARAGLETLRPDRPPLLIDTSAHRLRLWMYAALFVIVLSSYVWLHFGAVRFARKPFARACREIGKLERLRSQSQSQDSYRPALRALHRAFDETNGARLFSERVQAFLDEHTRFVVLRAEIEQFFALSRDEFFGGGEAATPRKPDAVPEAKAAGKADAFLRSFCRAMRERESAARSDVARAT